MATTDNQRRPLRQLIGELSGQMSILRTVIASMYPGHPFRSYAIRILAWPWRMAVLLRGIVISIISAAAVAATAGIVTYLTTPYDPSKQPQPDTWAGYIYAWHIGQWVTTNLGMLIILAAVVCLIILSSRWANLALVADSATSILQPEYIIRQVRRLHPQLFLARYVAAVYLTRTDVAGANVDATARDTLRLAMQQSDDCAGICVFGRPTEGKTRLIWEAVREVLPDWILVAWPHGSASRPFDFRLVHGRHIVLWLDNVHEYANDTEASTLLDLPRRFVDAGAQVVAVATCRDGSDESEARTKLGPLLERLAAIRPTDITQAEAHQLVKDLEAVGAEALPEEFDGTPGSLLLGVRRMREQRYPALTENAKRVLRALKLLRAAGVYAYPEGRARGVAEDIFGLEDNEGTWRALRRELVEAGFVYLGATDASGRRALAPRADVYLERSVPDYPDSGAMERDDWPQLRSSLVRCRDADALVSLGNSWYSTLDTSQCDRIREAEVCYRAAREQYEREGKSRELAGTLNNIGNALLAQAELCARSREEKEGFLDDAIIAYRTSLEWSGSNTSSALAAAATQHNLALVLITRAIYAQGSQQLDILREAHEAVRAELQLYSEDENPKEWATAQVALAEVSLHTAVALDGSDNTPVLLSAAETRYRNALHAYARVTDENMEDLWAGTEFGLAIVLFRQAEMPGWPNRVAVLTEAATLYRSALTVFTEEHSPEQYRRLQKNLSSAEGLLSELLRSGE